MRLIEIHLDGFGRLVDRTLQFGPGFNLIFGPNEAGKSTLQRAMLALLFGFLEEGRVSSIQKDSIEAVKPWEESAPYAGSLAYALDDGRQFQVSRTFAPHPTTTLATWPSGQDISDQFRSASQGRLFFADAQIGMSKQVFENTCYVRQAELVALETSASAITETLMRLSSSASADTTTADAITLLENASREQVGSDRAWTRPLAKARKRLKELEQEQAAALQARRELYTEVVALNQVEEHLMQLDLERQKLHYLEALVERDGLWQKQDAVAKIGAEVERYTAEIERWSAWADFPVQLRDDVLRSMDHLGRLEKECAELEPRAQTAQGQLKELNKRMSQTQDDIRNLIDAQDVPISQLASLRELLSQFDLAQARYQTAQEHLGRRKSALLELQQRAAGEQEDMGPLMSVGYAGLAKLQQQIAHCVQTEEEAAADLRDARKQWSALGVSAEEFEDMKRTAQAFQASAQDPPSRKGCAGLLSFGSSKSSKLPPPQVCMYEQTAPIYEHFVQARNELQAVQAAKLQVESEVRAQVGQFGESSLDSETFLRLEKRLSDHQELLNDMKQKTRDIADAEAESVAAQQGLTPLVATLEAKLRELGLGDLDPRKALKEFEKQCDRHTKLRRAQELRKQLELESASVSRDIESLRDKFSEMQGMKERLCQTLLKAGINCTPDTAQDAVTKFDLSIANHEHWQKAHDAQRSAIARQNTLLSEQSLDDVLAALAVAQAKLQGLLQAHPEWAVDLPPFSGGSANTHLT